MKKKSVFARLFAGLLLVTAVLSMSGCSTVLYYHPGYTYSGRPTPPSGLYQRVLVTYTTNGSSGGAVMLDGLRDLRGNIQNTVTSFPIAGFSSAYPSKILNFPEQTRGYVYGLTDGALTTINYSTEAGTGTAASFGAYSPSVAMEPNATRFMGAVYSQGVLEVALSGGSYVSLNLPGVNKVVMNAGNSILLAMVNNSNTVYRVIKLPQTTSPVLPPGYIDCEPLTNPVYCVVPVKGTFDHPVDAAFSTDGSAVYVVNCGPECSGTTASISVLQPGTIQVDQIPTVDPASSAAPTSMQTLPVANPIPTPGGATVALSNGTNLYVAGQQKATTGSYAGLWAGNLSTINLSTYTVTSKVSISDGNHTKLLFADNSTLWVGANTCATGVRAATATAELAATGTTDAAGNYNCLTSVSLAGTTPVATIVPTVVQSSTNPTTVPYPNTDNNQYYYGNLTGLCWVQNYNKVYTAYGGQIHAFKTSDNSEIDNYYLTIQGTALDVAYMDALTNSSN
ncbi:hypothetical protein [Granulicella cerasi]|uniref:hypothetical protein n=1 Tax=Granulicella cerasi TaxID=741063 RepID=UPI0021E0D7CD|nr:hypothetical protein [Granulicella cerasi]